MSFEPKIFNSDELTSCDGLPRPAHDRAPLCSPAEPLWDDAAQLELPDDLAMLAEQLRDDALHLAACHPAAATPQQRAAAWLEVQKSAAPQTRVARLRWWATGAAAAALFLGASWFGWSLNQSPVERPAEVAVVSTERESEGPATNEIAARIQGADAPRPPGADALRVIRLPEDSPPRVIPAGAFLQDVSGPELDAMLELLAEQTDTGLSI